MAILEIQDLSFHYPAGEQAVLDRVNLAVEPGEFVLLCGTSGCGKTTLLRHIKKELAPFGARSGELLFQGKPLSSYDDRYISRNIGMVQQSPENQTVTDRVLSELVFTMENVGFPSDLMRRRAAELSHYFGLDALLGKHVFELSGGQKQLVQLASVLALQPQLLLLDEPT
ncbi:ABC transporter ATP-binding protein, partial [Paenibacillus validus]|nr:ABC transporter ATP-binding protein [Paenibacillus validus]